MKRSTKFVLADAAAFGVAAMMQYHMGGQQNGMTGMGKRMMDGT